MDKQLTPLETAIAALKKLVAETKEIFFDKTVIVTVFAIEKTKNDLNDAIATVHREKAAMAAEAKRTAKRAEGADEMYNEADELIETATAYLQRLDISSIRKEPQAPTNKKKPQTPTTKLVKAAPRPSINELLPLEVLDLIMRYYLDFSTRCNARLACSHWASIINTKIPIEMRLFPLGKTFQSSSKLSSSVVITNECFSGYSELADSVAQALQAALPPSDKKNKKQTSCFFQRKCSKPRTNSFRTTCSS